MDVLRAESKFFNVRGLPVLGRQAEKEIAIREQNLSFQSGMRGIQEYARSVNLSSEAVTELQDNLRKLNEIKLANISAQFDPFQQVANSAIAGLQNGIEGLLNGTQSLGDAFMSWGATVADTLAKVAAEWITNELVRGIFGMSRPSQGTLGSIADIGSGGVFGGLMQGLGAIFGFSDGGNVGTGSFNEYRKMNNPIGEALRREGNNSVLAALTPGEQVLNTVEADIYRKMFPTGLKAAVLNFNSGGAVPGMSSNVANVLNKAGNSVNVNMSVDAGSTATNSDGKSKALEKQLRSVVIAELQRQQQPGGILST